MDKKPRADELVVLVVIAPLWHTSWQKTLDALAEFLDAIDVFLCIALPSAASGCAA
jgi:hypothetical protein